MSWGSGTATPHSDITQGRNQALRAHSSWTLDSRFLWFTNADVRIQLPQPALPGPQMAPQLCVFHAGLVLSLRAPVKKCLKCQLFHFFKVVMCAQCAHVCSVLSDWVLSFAVLWTSTYFYTVSPKAHNHIKGKHWEILLLTKPLPHSLPVATCKI